MSRLQVSEKESSQPTAGDHENKTLWDVKQALTDVFDPELGANIVDLGLLYKLETAKDHTVVVSIMLPSATPGYSLSEVIEEQVATALQGICGSWRVSWIGIPSWGPDRITEKGRHQMRGFGSKP